MDREMHIMPGERRQISLPVPPELHAILLDASQRGTLDFHNGERRETSRDHFTREVSVLVDNEVAIAMEISWECRVGWWERFKSRILRRPLKCGDIFVADQNPVNLE